MDSDNESFHSESEFYYPEELDLENNQNESNYQALPRKNEDFKDEIKKSIEQQRPVNTKKKTKTVSQKIEILKTYQFTSSMSSYADFLGQ